MARRRDPRVSRRVAAPRVSACLIVRDEARLLGRCLRSVADAVDEICVVDTGSKDGTLEVARRFGSVVTTFRGCNDAEDRMADFAAARNAALDLATGEWVLQIDADEELKKGSAQIVRSRVRSEERAAVAVSMQSEISDWSAIKLFRRIARLRYVSRVHEYLPVEPADCVHEPRIVIRHLPDKRGKESSNARNMRLCLAELAEEPRSGRALYFLGNALRGLDRLDEAIAAYSKCLELRTFERGRFAATYWRGVCHMRKRQWQQALDDGHAAIRSNPLSAEAHCLLGDAYVALDQVPFARQWYRSALACGGRPDPEAAFFGVRDMYAAYPRMRLRQLGGPRDRANAL